MIPLSGNMIEWCRWQQIVKEKPYQPALSLAFSRIQTQPLTKGGRLSITASHVPLFSHDDRQKTCIHPSHCCPVGVISKLLYPKTNKRKSGFSWHAVMWCMHLYTHKCFPCVCVLVAIEEGLAMYYSTMSVVDVYDSGCLRYICALGCAFKLRPGNSHARLSANLFRFRLHYSVVGLAPPPSPAAPAYILPFTKQHSTSSIKPCLQITHSLFHHLGKRYFDQNEHHHLLSSIHFISQEQKLLIIDLLIIF